MLFNPIKDQTIDGLEEWLKNNKPTVIPRGASTATGYTPPQPSERTQQESKQRAREVNRMVRAENAAKKAEAKANYKAQKALADNQAIGEIRAAIKDFREKAGLGDFGRLASIVGVDRKTLSRWESGVSVPDTKNMEGLYSAIASFKYTTGKPERKPYKRSSKPKPVIHYVPLEEIEAFIAEFKSKCFKGDILKFSQIAKIDRDFFSTRGRRKFRVEDFAELKLHAAVFEFGKPVERLQKKKPPTQEQTDRKEAAEAKKLALESGLREFFGICKTHGKTTLKLHANGRAICPRCRPMCKPKKMIYPNMTVREHYNRELMKQSKTGFFTGYCLTHGDTPYRIVSKGKYRCMACLKTPDPVTIDQKNVAARTQALAESRNTFDGICKKHGETEFRIENPNGRTIHRCKLCVKEKYLRQQAKKDKSANARNAEENRNRMRSALDADSAARKFIGLCKVHGDTTFRINSEKRIPSGRSYHCILCKNNVKI